MSSHDAHTWVEVRFPTYGWIPFEPTPGITNPAVSAYQPGPADEPTPECRGPRCGGTPDQPKNVHQTQQLFDAPRNAGGAPLPPIPTVTAPAASPWTPQRLLLIAVGLAALALLLVPPFRAWRRRRRLHRARHDPRQLILATYDVFTERAAELGFVRLRGETLDEYRPASSRPGGSATAISTASPRVASGAAYSPREPGDEDARAAADGRRQRRLRSCGRARSFGPARDRRLPTGLSDQEPVAVCAAASRRARTNFSRSSSNCRTFVWTPVAMSSIATKNAI